MLIFFLVLQLLCCLLAWSGVPSRCALLGRLLSYSRNLTPEDDFGGFLYVLVIGLVFVAPFIHGFEMYVVFNYADVNFDFLKSDRDWAHIKDACWGCFEMEACGSFYCGVNLLLKRTRAVVLRAIAGVWICWPISWAMMGFVIPMLISGADAYDARNWAPIITQVILAAIVTVYLTKSKRVQTMYGN